MIIRNKFNGYGFDGARLYNDPATLALMATASSTAATTAAVAAPTIAATTATALPTVVAAGSTLPTTAAFTGQAVTPALTSAGGSGLAGTTAGSVAPGAFGSGITGGTTTLPGMTGAETLASASPEIASNLAAAGNTGIMSGAPGAVTPVTTAPVTTAPAGPLSNPTFKPPVDMTNAGFSGNYTGAAESSKGLTAKGFDPNVLGQGGASTPPGVNVTPEMASNFGTNTANAGKSVGDYFMETMKFAEKNPLATSAAAQGIQYLMRPKPPKKKQYSGSDMSSFEASEPNAGIYTPVYETSSSYAMGGQVEQMAAQNAVGANTGYPMANLQTPMYTNPAMQRPQATNVVAPSGDAGVNTYTGEPRFAQGGSTSNKYLKMLEEEEKKRREDAEEAESRTKKFDVGVVSRSRTQQLSSPYAAALQELQAAYKKRGIPFAKPAKTSMDVMGDSLDEVPYAAGGGIMSHLGGYSDGGRLLKGPGDGMSDSIPAKIGAKQPARLADGEFVIPADVVSHLGNGSTEAGAKKLYAMMNKVRHARTGNKKQGKQINPDKFIPKA